MCNISRSDILIFLARCPIKDEAPVVPYEEEELSYLEDDDTEPVSAAELLARWEGFSGEEYVEEEKYL